MNCIVTAGPTYEPLDTVRRLTNFSTGQLGSELGNYLAARGHDVTLLIGEQATYAGAREVACARAFSTTTDLRDQLRARAGSVDAIFHAAAVSDFTFGGVWTEDAAGSRQPARAGKISTRSGKLFAELIPTPKILSELRVWHPQARIVGWKYEVDGNSADALDAGRRQMRESSSDACVVNGPAYGPGFGLLLRGGDPADAAEKLTPCATKADLFALLTEWLGR